MSTLPQREKEQARSAHVDVAARAELRALRAEIAALRRLLDEGFGAFLNAKFPYGRPTDRWARRR